MRNQLYQETTLMDYDLFAAEQSYLDTRKSELSNNNFSKDKLYFQTLNNKDDLSKFCNPK